VPASTGYRRSVPECVIFAAAVFAVYADSDGRRSRCRAIQMHQWCVEVDGAEARVRDSTSVARIAARHRFTQARCSRRAARMA